MQHDVVVIGGGIVGLATAVQLKAANPALKLVVIEKEDVLAGISGEVASLMKQFPLYPEL